MNVRVRLDETASTALSTPAARRLTALLRARARRLLRELDPATAHALEMLPALFHANFPWPQLKSDPPGVEGVRASLRWTRLARDFDLPAPTGLQRGRRLVAALLVTPLAHPSPLLDVHVVPVPNLSPYDEQRIAQRARAVEALFRRRHLAVRIVATGPSAQPYDGGSRTRLLSFGALVAGRLPAAFFEPGAPSTGALSAQPWLTAPTELARTLSLLTLDPWPAGEVAELLEVADLARAAGQPLWRFAEPGLLMAARAALRSRRPQLAFDACALAEPSAGARATAWGLARHLGAGGFGPAEEPLSAEDVLRVGRALALELTRAVRAQGLGEDARALRALLPHQVLGGGCPRVLLKALQAGLRRAAREGEVPAMLESWAGRAVEVRLGSGALLGRGANAAQAWVRALSLVGHAWGSGVVPRGLAPVWRKVAPKLTKAPRHKTLWLEVEPRARPSQPADPLNRGPSRELGLAATLVVALRPRGRPTGRLLTAEQTTPLLLQEAVRGTALGFVPGDAEAQPLEARLLRIARRCKGVTAARPIAVQAGGAVFVVNPDGVERREGRVFARRPVRCALDAEAPDFGVEVTQGRDVRVGPNQVECLVWSDDGLRARVLTADSRGWVLREAVPIELVERHLTEAQQLLRAHPMSALSVRVAPSMSSLGLLRRDVLTPAVAVRVSGELPFRLELEVDGERFGARNRWGWKAAASAVLAHWPPGVMGEVHFQDIDVSIDGVRASGLWRLYVRSLARRRLSAHIESLSHTFRVRGTVPNR